VGLARDAGAHEHDTGVSVGRIEREGDWKTGMHADASDRRSLAQSRLPATFHVSVPPVAWRRTRYASTRPHNLDPRPNATISPLSWKRRREQDVRQFPPATTAAKVNRIWRIGQFTLSSLMLPGETPCLCRPSHGNSRRAQVIRARDRRHSDGAKTPQYVFVRVEFYRCSRRRRHAGRAPPEGRACRRGVTSLSIVGPVSLCGNTRRRCSCHGRACPGHLDSLGTPVPSAGERELAELGMKRLACRLLHL